jgi:peptide-methionine (S)-S-oxide reductase
MATATFGAGCFWGVEETFRRVEGVTGTAVGYAGGATDAPTYKDVCAGGTGHAEVVQVEYDPDAVTYEALLETFWSAHDPTQKDRQGPDVGAQYRSVIFFHTSEQEQAARSSMATQDGSGRFPRPIVTQIAAAAPFHRAEEYHQQYLAKRGQASCSTGIPPTS